MIRKTANPIMIVIITVNIRHLLFIHKAGIPC